MRLFINAFKQGIARIFTLPRLSLPLVTTLGLTLAAVLTVVAVANTLLFKPLPDIDEKNLYQVDLNLGFGGGFEVSFFSSARRVAAIKVLFGDELEWGHITSGAATVEVGGNDITVSRFDAVTGSPEVLGLTLLKGQGSNIDNAEEGIWISKSLWLSAYSGIEELTQQTLRVDGTEYPIFGVFDDFTSMDDLTSSGQNTDQIWRFQNFDELLSSPDQLIMSLGPITLVRGPKNAIPSPEYLEEWFEEYVNTEIAQDTSRQFLLSKPITGVVRDYRNAFIGDSEQLVFVLLFAMFSLLIMACLNLLNMFIAHYQSRNKEFAIQICMGSSVGKLRALIFTENLPMFLMATVLGLISAGWLMEILPTLAGDNLPLLDQIAVDVTSVMVALLVIISINFVFAALALLYLDKTKLTDSLNSSGKGTPGQQKQTVSKALMVLQLSLACILLTGASMSVKQSYQDAYADLGYAMPNAHEVRMQITDDEWRTALQEYDNYLGSEWQQLRSDFVSRLSGLGGEVLDIDALPLTANVRMDNFPDPDTGDSVMIRPIMWGPGLLSEFDIELLAGRNLSNEDIDLPHVLISQSFAMDRAGEMQWQNIVGTELKMGVDDADIVKVVGVVEDIMPLPSGTINVDAPEVYFANPSRLGVNVLSAVLIMPDGANLTLEQVELVMKGIDPRLGEIQIDSMQQRWDSSTEATRLNMYVVMSLATLTLVLAAIGVSGLSQMSASQKRYELAVRMATGAKQSRLLQLLLKDSLLMLVFGLGLGVLAAIGAYQYLQAFFDTAPVFDWSVTTAINIILAVVMLLSIAIPGWLVIRKDPMRVLREL